MSQKHVMLDLETMGNTSYSSVISIGAVSFDIDSGERFNQFYQKIDFKSCLDVGLGVDASTIEWWLKQNEEARKLATQKGDNIYDVLKLFSEWFELENKNSYIWGNGARFDMGLLEDAYIRCKLDIPWSFRNELDLRTMVFLDPATKNGTKFEGIRHDPISDCNYQIDYLTKIYGKRGIKRD